MNPLHREPPAPTVEQMLRNATPSSLLNQYVSLSDDDQRALVRAEILRRMA